MGLTLMNSAGLCGDSRIESYGSHHEFASISVYGFGGVVDGREGDF